MRIPDAVLTLAAGGPLREAWRNELGGLTYELDGRFVKWAPAGSGLDLAGEAERMRWAGRHTEVPRVLKLGSGTDGTWLLTAALPGECAVSERWREEPERAVEAIGRGLRALHDRLPVAGCPFSWRAEERVRVAGSIPQDPSGRWQPEHRGLSVAEALAAVRTPPPVDRLVVCHGDACAPNTILARDGSVAGHVDLGSLGVGDRWADLAVATWSTEWNYGPGLEGLLLEAYGVEPDPERTAYYRLLWDLGP